MRRSAILFALAALVFAPSFAAAATPAEKCEAAKSKLAGGFYACREKAEATAILKGTPVSYTKCDTKFDDKFEAAETKSEDTCPDVVSTPSMKAFLTSQATQAAAILAGAAIPDCGDNLVNVVGEQCDGTDLGGASCASFGYLAGSLSCDAGCQLDTSGCDVCPGVDALGACWVIAAASASCDTTCAGIGMVYDTATETVAGSSGSLGVCSALLDLVVGVGVTPGEGPCVSGWGCLHTSSGSRLRCTSPATTGAASGGGAVQRLCGCQAP